MTGSFYGQPDYVFGQAMLRLRTRIGLTQAGLAELVGVSRKTVSRWEAGSSHPHAEHLQKVLAFAAKQQVFAVGGEAEEIRTFWRLARQKVLLDERWLHDLLQHHARLPAEGLTERAQSSEGPRTPQALARPRVDWGDALDVPAFYGREEEVALLAGWIVEERCRLVSVLGMGGIGKSALVTTLMRQVAERFDVVIWRSLRDSPACETLIDSCVQVLAPQALSAVGASFESRLQSLMDQLRAQRVLLVLDNGEVLLEEGASTGQMRAGFEGYTRLLYQVGETAHQSCLLLTSREKPASLAPLEGRRSLVRAVRLAGLHPQAGIQLLEEKDVVSSASERAQLVEVYQGNPLALKIVAQTIVELFAGEITPFLQQGEVIFGGVRALLDEQFLRLSAIEQTVVWWLAVLREPVSLDDLLAVVSAPMPRAQLLDAVDGLRRRSLIEQGQRAGSFTLQSVVLEYATARLIAEAGGEIQAGRLARLLEHNVCQAQAKEYVRRTQEQLLVAPLLALLQGSHAGDAEIEARLLWLLDQLRTQGEAAQGYGPANLVTLLRVLRGHLRKLDLSRLALRGVFLQGVEMQDTTLSGAVLHHSVFTTPLDGIVSVAISSTGNYLAVGTRRGDVQVWAGGGLVLRTAWRGLTGLIWILAFGQDDRTLAGASVRGTIKLWDIDSGALLWERRLIEALSWIAFSSHRNLLAGGGADGVVRLWTLQSDTPPRVLRHTSTIAYLAWSPDDRLLAVGCVDGTIWLWQTSLPDPLTPLRVLTAHTLRVTGVTFSPDGLQLASVSYDGTLKLWDVSTGECLQTLVEHTTPLVRVTWSTDGHTLACGRYGNGTAILVWDLQEGRVARILQGHTGMLPSLDFMPASRTLLSGGYDGTLRVWDADTGQCLRNIEGHTASLFDLDWSPDGTRLTSSSADRLVTVWDAASGIPQITLTSSSSTVQGLGWRPEGVAWRPDGQLLAIEERDRIGLWDVVTGVCLHELRDPTVDDAVFQGVAWHPDGQLLAVGSYFRGVHVWDTTTGSRRWGGQEQATQVRRVAWSPDGRLLAGGAYGGAVYVWNAVDGTSQRKLGDHGGAVLCVGWRPDGQAFASGGDGSEGGQLVVWDVESGERMRALVGQGAIISALVWSPNGKLLISGDSDGRLSWWDVERAECLRVQTGHELMVQTLKVSPDGSTLASCGDDGAIRLWDLHSGELLQALRRDRPYERLNITGVRGLSEVQKAALGTLGAIEKASTTQ